MTALKLALRAGLPICLLATACSDPKSSGHVQAPAQAQSAAETPVTTVTVEQAQDQNLQVVPTPEVQGPITEAPAIAASAAATAQPIQTADWRTASATPGAKRDALIRAESCCRARISRRASLMASTATT